MNFILEEKTKYLQLIESSHNKNIQSITTYENQLQTSVNTLIHERQRLDECIYNGTVIDIINGAIHHQKPRKMKDSKQNQPIMNIIDFL